jgi:hypothetical protein
MLATEQAKLVATCSGELLSSNVMSTPLLGSRLSTTAFFSLGNLYLASIGNVNRDGAEHQMLDNVGISPCWAEQLNTYGICCDAPIYAEK